MRKIFMTVCFMVVMVALSACGDVVTSPGATPVATQSGEQASQQRSLKVGQQGMLDGFAVKVNSVKETRGEDFDKISLKAGQVYIVLNVTIDNTGPESKNVSSLAQFALRDASGQEYTEEYLSTAKKAPDGILLSDHVLAGDLVYKVPTAEKMFTLIFQAAFLGSDQMTWDINV